MLDRDRRIHSAKDFQRVWRDGRALRGRLCVIRCRPAAKTRYGFVVSKAVARRATDRNRVQRRLRAIARHVHPPTPLEIVVYATKNAPPATYQDLRTEIEHLIMNYAPSTRRPH